MSEETIFYNAKKEKRRILREIKKFIKLHPQISMIKTEDNITIQKDVGVQNET